ncbi:MAG: FAD-binding oxidoreductase [Gemmatimonadaceae bacterium]
MTTSPASGARTGAAKIGPDDDRYRAVVDKRFNKRFAAAPDYVRLTESTAQVASAVEEAVREGRRLAITSGGHCLEGFVSNPDVRVIIDASPMKRIYYDAERGAVAVEAGATVGETFRALAESWGTVIPLGEYPHIGMGGHVSGGAFGFLCRQLGLAADYLYAVEVVTVDAGGRATTVVATREPTDPHRDLWWAHTGGGAGSFGAVTRSWFRSPNADSADPAAVLPRAPESVATFRAEWSWDGVDQAAFRRLVREYGIWGERHSAAGSPEASMWALLELHRKQFGTIVVRGVTTAAPAGAERLMDAHVGVLAAALGEPVKRERARMSWLDVALNPFPDLFAMPPGGVSSKVKDALLKRRLTDAQIDTAYGHLTRSDVNVMGGMMGFATYGGQVNAVAPDTTASPQRSAIFDTACSTGWIDPRDEAVNLAWVRALYRDLFAETGGVPVPGDAYDGCLINHPDVDTTDASLNTSGVAWPALYFQGNYPRLQRIKARWDPRNVFRHALSVRAG